MLTWAWKYLHNILHHHHHNPSENKKSFYLHRNNWRMVGMRSSSRTLFNTCRLSFQMSLYPTKKNLHFLQTSSDALLLIGLLLALQLLMWYHTNNKLWNDGDDKNKFM